MNASPRLRRYRPISILFTCLAVVAGSIAVIAVVIAVPADRLSRQIAEDDLKHLARNVSSFQATALRDALRLGIPDDAQAQLDRLQAEQAGQLLGAAIVRADGAMFASVGEMAEEDRLSLVNLANAATATAEPAITRAGFWIARPVLENGTVIGGLALAWTPQATLTRISEARFRSYFLAGIVVLSLMFASGVIFRVAISAPLRRLASRTAGLAKNELDAPIPGAARRDDIGLLSSQIDVLRNRLKQADTAAKEAHFQSAGFQGASVPLVMTDDAFRVTHANAAFRDLLNASPEFSGAVPPDLRKGLMDVIFDPRCMAGADFSSLPLVAAGPVGTDVKCDGRTFNLVLGAILDIFSAIVLVVPLILPVAMKFGVDPVHLGIVFLATMQLGYITPPVGLNLFIASYRFDRPVVELYLSTLPFFIFLLI